MVVVMTTGADPDTNTEDTDTGGHEDVLGHGGTDK